MRDTMYAVILHYGLSTIRYHGAKVEYNVWETSMDSYWKGPACSLQYFNVHVLKYAARELSGHSHLVLLYVTLIWLI